MKKLLQLLTFISLLIPPLCPSSIHEAVVDGNLDEVRRLIAANPSLVHDKDQSGNNRTPLHYAANRNQTDIAKFLIEHDANVNARDNTFFTDTPLICAVTSKDITMVELLIDNGADINFQVRGGLSALHLVADRNNTKIANLFIKRGANINLQDRYGNTPLHYAADRGHIKIAKLLINSGANVDVPTFCPATALHYAVYHKCTKMVELLVNSGADVAVQNNRNRTPLQVAENRDLKKIAQLLKTLPPLNKMLWHAVCRNNVKVANLALFKGASPNALAAQWMLPQGEDAPAKVVDCLNAAIERKDTPLHIAVENKNVEMVKLLLGFGGKINRQNRGGDTPLILAARRPEVLMTILEATTEITKAPVEIPEAIPQANSGRPKLFKRLLACFRAEK